MDFVLVRCDTTRMQSGLQLSLEQTFFSLLEINHVPDGTEVL